MEVGHFYTYKPKKQKFDDRKIWQFVKIDDVEAHFTSAPLIGVPEHLTVDHEEMKRFKKFEKELPVLIPDADFEKFNPLQSQQLQKELLRAEAQSFLIKHFQEQPGCI